MATNKRLPVKWVRDKAKAAYIKKDSCFICGTSEDLELHHLHSISILLEDWCKKLGINLESDDDILRVRDRFIEEHMDQIYNKVYTLCNTHHTRLHHIFGKSPANSTASKQESWLDIQKRKIEGTYIAPASPFEKFLKGK